MSDTATEHVIGEPTTKSAIIGDRPAKGLGMRTIWLRGEAPSTPSVEQLGEPDAVVTSLADAPAVIAGMAARAGATTGS